MKQGKYLHRCKDCAAEWYDGLARHPNYCPACLSQRKASFKLGAQERATKGAETRHLTDKLIKYGRRIRIGHNT